MILHALVCYCSAPKARETLPPVQVHRDEALQQPNAEIISLLPPNWKRKSVTGANAQSASYLRKVWKQ